jgi:hypothetical protein
MNEMMKRDSNDISAQQIYSTKKLCETITSVSDEKAGTFTAVVSAYIDGFITGQNLKAGEKNG